MSEPKRTVELEYLPPDFIKSLDILYGQLLVLNGGYAKWTLEIKDGKISRFLNEQQFLPEKLKLA